MRLGAASREDVRNVAEEGNRTVSVEPFEGVIEMTSITEEKVKTQGPDKEHRQTRNHALFGEISNLVGSILVQVSDLVCSIISEVKGAPQKPEK